MWDSTPTDTGPVYPDNISPGPKLGFLGALESAYNEQVRNSSLHGLAYSFMRADEAEENNARKNGKEYTAFYKRETSAYPEPSTGIVPTLGMNAYYKAARTIVDREDNDVLGDFAAHDAKTIEDNAKGGYQVKTLSEVFEGVKKKAEEAERRSNLPWTIPGYAGGIIGGLVGSLDPRTDPLNFATLPIGGVGKTVLGRVATQGLSQGAIETLNQLTGVQENRRLLGLDYGVSHAALSVAGAAAGGALVQGGAEAVVAGVRRFKTGKWFIDTPKDKAPPAPAEPLVDAPAPRVPDTAVPPGPERSPLWDSPLGRPRAEADLTAVHAQLSDWGGKRPWELDAPTADTRIPGAEPSLNFKWDITPGPETIDSIARRIDPETFAVYDKYAANKNAAREEIVALGAERNSKANEAVANVQDQIDELRQKTDGATRRLGKKYATRIAELEKQRDQFLAIETRGDTPEMVAKRQELMEVDYAMRDLKAPVNRAYAAAQNKWVVYEEQRKAIDKMIKDGAPGIGETPSIKLADEPPAIAYRANDPVPGRMLVEHKLGESVSEAIARHADAVQKIADDTLDEFGKFARAATKEVKEGETHSETHITLNINGKEVKLALDGGKITIPGEDGGTRSLTPRELLKEVDNDNHMLEAVSSCSISATS